MSHGFDTAATDRTTGTGGSANEAPAPHFALRVGDSRTVDGGRTGQISPSSTAAPRARRRRPAAGAWTVFRWDLGCALVRPTTCLMLLGSTLVAGWAFSWLVTLLSRGGGLSLRAMDDPIVQFLGSNVFLIGLATLLVPLVTMSLIADERRRGSWELLLTAPVSAGQIVTGKFFAAWLLWLACLAPWWYFALVLRFWTGQTRLLWNFIPWPASSGVVFDLATVYGSVAAAAVIGAVFIAFGLLCSGVCRRAASAALLTFVGMAVVLLISLLPSILHYANFPAEQIRLVEGLSVWRHWEQFSEGTFLPRVALGCAAVTVVLLTLAAGTSRLVDDPPAFRLTGSTARPWLRSAGRPAVLVGAVLAIVVSLGMWALPERVDLTGCSRFTLAPQTRNVLASLQEPVSITLLASREPKNAADREFQTAAVMFRELAGRYADLQPLISVGELDPASAAEARQLQQRFPDVAAPCIVVSLGEGNERRHEVLHARDVSAVRGDRHGRVAAIDFFGEQALTAALARLASGRRQSVVYVLTGYGELDLADENPESRRGLGMLAGQLREVDCELRPLDFRRHDRVPPDANLVLIPGAQEPLTDGDIGALERYLAHGGRALVLAELVYDSIQKRPAPNGLERLLAEYGVAIGDDRVITRGHTGRLEVASPGLPAAGDHPLVRSLAPAAVTLFECRSIRATGGAQQLADVKTIPVLVSHEAPDAWAEADFEPGRKPAPGGPADVDGPVAMAMAVERRRGDLHEPVLIVVGDAELAANHALTGPTGRAGLSFLLSSINWLRGRKELMGDIPPRRNEGYRLEGTEADHRGLVWKPLLLLCALMTTAGATVWTVRRSG